MNANRPIQTDVQARREMSRAAAKVFVSDSAVLAVLHSHFDDARQRGLPPHHAINAALGRLAGEEP